MTPQKLAAAESGLNGIARKVLEAVPIQEPWSNKQIAAELSRHGRNLDMRVVDGCLSHLRDNGLIKACESGAFVRVQAKPKVVRIDRQAERTDETDETHRPARREDAMPTPQPDPLDKMAQLAAAARQLANDIENVALEIEARAQEIQRDTEKLRQLQALLKSLN